jgi:hypothetical protein
MLDASIVVCGRGVSVGGMTVGGTTVGGMDVGGMGELVTTGAGVDGMLQDARIITVRMVNILRINNPFFESPNMVDSLWHYF